MLQFPMWKRVLVWSLCALGLLFAMPNLFYSKVELRNDAAKMVAAAGGVATPEQEAAIAAWPAFLPTTIVNLGLDLRGGAHLLAEVNVAYVYAGRMNGLWP